MIIKVRRNVAIEVKNNTRLLGGEPAADTWDFRTADKQILT